MSGKPWHQNTWVFLLLCLALPPAGLVLLWLRPGPKVVSKMAGSLALLALSVAHLFLFYGLRVEIAGTGMTPIFTFHDPEEHYEAIEESRQSAPEGVQAVRAATRRTDGSAYWTDFRGPNRDGHYAQSPIRTEWPSDGPPELWRQPVGGGYASVVVANGRIFTIEQRRSEEVAAAYDLATGNELWSSRWPARFQESMGGPGPRATPTWHEGKLYVLGAEGEFRCLEDSTGKLLWRLNILEDNGASNLTWGMAASPLIIGEKVIVLPGGSRGKSVAAYHKETGEPVWKALDDKQAYTSPMDVTLAGRRQILVVSAKRMMGVSIDDGALLWDYPWETSYDANCAQPLIVDGEHVFISAGYGHGAALVRVTSSGGRFRAEEVWFNNTMKNKFNPSVLYEGHVYGLDEGILACVDVRTGERKWKGGRYGYGQLLLASGHLVVISERGDLALVRATPERHQEMVKFSSIPGKTWNVPAISDGKLIVRNQTEMACYDVSLGSRAAR